MKTYIKYLLLILLCLATLRFPKDLDLGWHLRYGEYFFQTGHVLKDNILSFVWPAYKWVEASWGYDLVLYQLFTHFGFLGISICGYLISLATFLILIHPVKRYGIFQLIFLTAVFITQTYPLYGQSMRAQSLSALFMAYILIFMVSFSNGKPMTGTFHPVLFPFLFLFWANLHGSFFLGLLFLALFWGMWGILMLIKKSLIPIKQWVILGITIFASLFPPLLNPWGIKLYLESINHTQNINLTGITEWMPIKFFTLEWYLALATIALVLFFAIKRKNTRDVPFILLFLLMSYMAFTAIRFLMYFGMMATLFLSEHINKIFFPTIIGTILKILLIGLILYEVLFIHIYFTFPDAAILHPSWDAYCKPVVYDFLMKDCSEEITQAMRKDMPQGNGYHPYNYGGYLTWRVPELKTFMDGRMAGWEENGVRIPLDEADQIYIEPVPVMFRKFDSEYHFRWLIVPSFSPLTSYINELVKAGIWEKRYQDPYYAYYVKIK
jgi:hypothetical protein